MRLLARLFLFAALALVALSAHAEERITYLVPNAQGSPVAAMDAQGNVLWRESYAPWGERRTKPAANDAKTAYTGKPEDPATGLVYMGARWYDPDAARFTGIDPQGFEDGNPQSFGRYVYANNSPYRYADPNGESPIDAVFFAYDAATFAAAVYSGNTAAMWSSGEDLAASFVGVISPVPGTGEAIKGAKAASKLSDATGKLRIIIGENQKRVDKFASKNGGSTISDYLQQTGVEWTQEVNDQFIGLAKISGAEVVDIGPDTDRRLENRIDSSNGRPPSAVYGSEKKALKGYSGLTKAFERAGKYASKVLE